MASYVSSIIDVLVTDVLEYLSDEGPESSSDSSARENHNGDSDTVPNKKGWLHLYQRLDVSLLAVFLAVVTGLVIFVRRCRRRKVPRSSNAGGQLVQSTGGGRTTAPQISVQVHARHRCVYSGTSVFTSIKEEEEDDDSREMSKTQETPLKPVMHPNVHAAEDDLSSVKTKTENISCKMKDNSSVKFSGVQTILSRRLAQYVCPTSQKPQKEPVKRHQHGYTYASPRRKDTVFPKSGATKAIKSFQPNESKKRFKGEMSKRKSHRMKNRLGHHTLSSSLKVNSAHLKELDQRRQRSVVYRTRLPEGGKSSSSSPLNSNTKSHSARSVQVTGIQGRRASPGERRLVKRSKLHSSTQDGSFMMTKLNSDGFKTKMDWPTFFKTREAVRRNLRQKSPKKTKKPIYFPNSRRESPQKKNRKTCKKSKGNTKEKIKPQTFANDIGTCTEPVKLPNYFVHVPEPFRGLHVPAQLGNITSPPNQPGSFTIKRTATPVLSSLLGQGAFRTLWPQNAAKSFAPIQDPTENVNTGRHNTKFLGPKVADSNNETTETINSSKINRNSARRYTSTTDKNMSRVSGSKNNKLHEKTVFPVSNFPERVQFPETHIFKNIFSVKKTMKNEHVSLKMSSVETRQKDEFKNITDLGSLQKTVSSDTATDKKIVEFCTSRNNKLKLSSVYPPDESKDSRGLCIKHNLQSSKLLSKDNTKPSGAYEFKLTASSRQYSRHPISEEQFNFKTATQCTKEENTVQKCFLTKESNSKLSRDNIWKGHHNQISECSFQLPHVSFFAKDQDNTTQMCNTNATHDKQQIKTQLCTNAAHDKQQIKTQLCTNAIHNKQQALGKAKNGLIKTDPFSTVTAQTASTMQYLENVAYTETPGYRNLRKTSVTKEGNVFKITRNNIIPPRPTNDHPQRVEESMTTQPRHELFQQSFCLQSSLQKRTTKLSARCNTEVVEKNECNTVTTSKGACLNDTSRDCLKPPVHSQVDRPSVSKTLQAVKQISNSGGDKLIRENKYSLSFRGASIQKTTLGPYMSSNAQEICYPVSKIPAVEKWMDSSVRVQDRLNQSNSSTEGFSGVTSDCVGHTELKVPEKCDQPPDASAQNSTCLHDSQDYIISSHGKGLRLSASNKDRIPRRFHDQQTAGKPAVKLNVFRGHAVKKARSLISLRNMLNELTSHVRANQATKQSPNSPHVQKAQGKTLLYFQPLRSWFPKEEQNNQGHQESIYFPVSKGNDIVKSTGNSEIYEGNGRYVKFYRSRKIKSQRHEPYKKRMATSSDSTIGLSSGHYWTKNKNNCSPSRRGRYFLGPVVDKHMFADQKQQSEGDTSHQEVSNPTAVHCYHQQDNASSSSGAAGLETTLKHDKISTQVENTTTTNDSTDISAAEHADDVQAFRRHNDIDTVFPFPNAISKEHTMIGLKSTCREPVDHSLIRCATRQAPFGQTAHIQSSQMGQKSSGNGLIEDKSSVSGNTEQQFTNNSDTTQKSTGNYDTGQKAIGNYDTGQPSTGNYHTGLPASGNYHTGQPATGNLYTEPKSTGNYYTGQRFTGKSYTRQTPAGNFHTEQASTGNFETGQTSTGNFRTGQTSKAQKSTFNSRLGRPLAKNVIRRHTVVGQAGTREARYTITRQSNIGTHATGKRTQKFAIAEGIPDGRTAGGNLEADHAATELKSVWSTVTGHKTAGNTTTEHKTAGNTATEHKTAGNTATEHKTAWNTVTEHKTAGNTAAENKTLENIAAEHNIVRKTAMEIKTAENTATEHTTVRSPSAEFTIGENTVTETEIVGNTSAELTTFGNSAIEHKSVDNRSPETKTVGNTAIEHKTIDNGSPETKTVGNTAIENKTVRSAVAGHNITKSAVIKRTEVDYTTTRHTTREHKSSGRAEIGSANTWQTKFQKDKYGQQDDTVKTENHQRRSALLTKYDQSIDRKSNFACYQKSPRMQMNVSLKKTVNELPSRRGKFSFLDNIDVPCPKSRTSYRMKGIKLPHTRVGRIKSQLSLSKLKGIRKSHASKHTGSFKRESHGSSENLKTNNTSLICDDQKNQAGKSKEVAKPTPATQNHMTQTESLILSVHVGVQTSPNLHATPKRTAHICKMKKYLVNSKLIREKKRHKESTLPRQRLARGSRVETKDESSPSKRQVAGICIQRHPTNLSPEDDITEEMERWDCNIRHPSDQTLSTTTSGILEREYARDCNNLRGHHAQVAENETQKIAQSLEHRHSTREQPPRKTAYSNPRDRQGHHKEDLKELQDPKTESTVRTEPTENDTITNLDKRHSDDRRHKEKLAVSEIYKQDHTVSEQHVDTHDDQTQEPHYRGNVTKQKYSTGLDDCQTFLDKSETNIEKNSGTPEGTIASSRAGALQTSDSSLMSFRLSELRKFCVIRPVWKNANVEEIDRRVRRALRLREELKQTGSSGGQARSLIASYFEASAADSANKCSDDIRGGTSSIMVSDIESTNRSTYFPVPGIEPSSFPDTASDDTLCQTVEQVPHASRRSSSESDHTAQEDAAAGFESAETTNQKHEDVFSENDRQDENELDSRLDNSISFQEETSSEPTSRPGRPSSARLSSHPSNSNSGNSAKRAGMRQKNSPPTKIPKVENTSTSTPRLVGALVQKLPQVPLTSFVEWFIETSDPNNFVASDRSSSSSNNSPSDSAYCALRAPDSVDDFENSSLWLDTSYNEALEHDNLDGHNKTARPFEVTSDRMAHLQEIKQWNQPKEPEMFTEKTKLQCRKAETNSIARKSKLPRSFMSTIPGTPSTLRKDTFSRSEEMEEESVLEMNSGKLIEERMTPLDAMKNTGIFKCPLKFKCDEIPSNKLVKGASSKFNTNRLTANSFSFNRGTSKNTHLQRQLSISSRRQFNEDISTSDSSKDRVLQPTTTDLSKLNLLFSPLSKESTSSKPNTTTTKDKSTREIANCSPSTNDQSEKLQPALKRNQDNIKDIEITRTADNKKGLEIRDQTEVTAEQSDKDDPTVTKDFIGDNRYAPGIRHILMKLQQMTDIDDSALPRPDKMKITLRKSSDVTGIIAKFQNKQPQ